MAEDTKHPVLERMRENTDRFDKAIEEIKVHIPKEQFKAMVKQFIYDEGKDTITDGVLHKISIVAGGPRSSIIVTDESGDIEIPPLLDDIGEVPLEEISVAEVFDKARKLEQNFGGSSNRLMNDIPVADALGKSSYTKVVGILNDILDNKEEKEESTISDDGWDDGFE